jgi:Glycosyl transferase family 2
VSQLHHLGSPVPKGLNNRHAPQCGSPWLSVVMPTYNGARHVPTALGSVQAQADSVEVVAIDDGSTDDTVAILESFKKSIRLHIIERPHSGNWVSSANLGLSVASGEWACFLHQDDLWLPGRVATLKAALTRQPDLSLVLHPSWFIDEHGKRLGMWRCPLPANCRPLNRSRLIQRLLVQNFIAVPAPFFRRDLALQVGGLNERLWYTADWDFWLKLATVTRAAYLPEPLTSFRLHSGSQTVRGSQKLTEFRAQLESVLHAHLGAYAAAGGDGDSLRPLCQFSVDMNVSLAAALHGDKLPWHRLGFQFLSLGARGWHCYLRDSRLTERVAARIRARMLRTNAANREEAVARSPRLCQPCQAPTSMASLIRRTGQ